jgi:hypothetical protein
MSATFLRIQMQIPKCEAETWHEYTDNRSNIKLNA